MLCLPRHGGAAASGVGFSRRRGGLAGHAKGRGMRDEEQPAFSHPSSLIPHPSSTGEKHSASQFQTLPPGNSTDSRSGASPSGGITSTTSPISSRAPAPCTPHASGIDRSRSRPASLHRTRSPSRNIRSLSHTEPREDLRDRRFGD